MENYGTCPNCGAEKVLNPKTGKTFCKEKCWLKGQQTDSRKTGIDRFSENLRDNTIQQMAKEKRESIELAHAENMRATCLDAASRVIAANNGNKDDVLALAEEYRKWVVEGKNNADNLNF